MDKSDQQDRMARYEATTDDDILYIDYDREFAAYVNDYVIQPFGKTLNQDLMDLFQKRLDLGEGILKSLKDAANLRHTARKPQTPIKKCLEAQWCGS